MKVDPKQMTDMFIHAVAEFCSRNPSSLQEINMIIFEDSVYSVFKQQAEELAKVGSGPKTSSPVNGNFIFLDMTKNCIVVQHVVQQGATLC